MIQHRETEATEEHRAMSVVVARIVPVCNRCVGRYISGRTQIANLRQRGNLIRDT